MKYWIVIVLVAIGMGGGGFWLWQSQDNRPSTGADHSTAASPLAIVVSGDTKGWIVPCGCTSSQSGGLLRRGTFLKTLQKKHDVLAVDVGGAAGGTSDYERVKFEAILKGELAMGVVAHNLGGSEAAFGAEVLRNIAQKLNVPFVSANIRDNQGDLLAQPHLIVEAGGKRVGMIGVISQTYQTDGLKIDEPRDAVLRSLSEIGEDCDSVIVLAYLPESELRALAAALPEVDAVLGGPTGQNILPVQVGPTLLASATNKGRFLLTLKPPADEQTGRWTAKFTEMDAQFSDDENQQANLDAFRTELEQRDIAAKDSGFAMFASVTSPKEFRVAGSQSCVACHSEETEAWAASAHHHAWETLVQTNAHVDSYCQQCHTTGFGLPGGFVSARLSSERYSVGCESCHGPSAGHVANPQIRTPFTSTNQCHSCHDHENSPEFEYAGYWELIFHGKPKPDVANGGASSSTTAEEQP